jgi:hypothetical protein
MLFALTIMCLVLASMATAGTITYDTGLVDPGTYFGSGNANTGWTVLTASTPNGVLELGLSVVNRYLGPATEINDDYYVPTGATTVPGKTGSEWGINFSVNTNVGGTGTGTLAAYTYNLLITDLTTLQSVQFDPSAIPDDSHIGGTSPYTGFQNSEAPSYSFISVPLSYNMNATDNYQVTLYANPVSGAFADPSVSIQIHAQSPEPATFGLIGATLLGLAVLGKRCFKKQ